MTHQMVNGFYVRSPNSPEHPAESFAQLILLERCEAAPTILTAPPTKIIRMNIKNSDSMCLLIEIHHHVDGPCFAEPLNCQF